MNADLFRSSKGVHVKLQTEVHAEFRKKLLEYGISMQKVFNNFAKLVATGDPEANKIVKGIIREDLKKKIKKLNDTPKENSLIDAMGNYDTETLYNLIEEGK